MLEIVQVDAFTNEPFRGNPAAVCVLDRPADDAWMQNVALEMNYSETAFLHPVSDGIWRLRWFTPTRESALCGHATLASAHTLWTHHEVAGDTLRFETHAGLLTARRTEDLIALDFPARPVSEVTAHEPLVTALGVTPEFAGQFKDDYLIEVANESIVRAATPDMHALMRLPIRAVVLTAEASTDDFDFVSRFFAPAVGVPEDPVTGSAHCILGPYWKERLSRDPLVGYQASARGGRVETEVDGDRVILRGQAVTTLIGSLTC